MKIEVRERIKVTEEELSKIQSVNDRPSMSDEIHRDVKHRKRGSYNPGDGTFEEFMETHNE